MSRTRPADDAACAAGLAAAAGALARNASLDAAVQAILEAATRTVAADRAIAFLEDPDRPTAELIAGVGLDHHQFAEAASELGQPGHPIVESVRARQTVFDRAVAGGGTSADLPLVVSREGIERPVGGLSMTWSSGPPLDEAERAFVVAIADLAAVAVERFRLASLIAERSDWFERLAHTDPLTGLANQRTLARVLELELARASRQGSEVSVAIFDVDDFAATNEAAGHQAGDDVLRSVAAVLGESVRLVDTVARLGADEFVLVAPGPAGMTVARRVIAGVAELPGTPGATLSLSAGVARFPRDGTTTDELLEAARAALDAARRTGPGTLAEASARVGSTGGRSPD
ncbi:MAG TPA: sensor domain-containing diguanylate cyclase [Candidatus Limnocylindrales bacterium]